MHTDMQTCTSCEVKVWMRDFFWLLNLSRLELQELELWLAEFEQSSSISSIFKTILSKLWTGSVPSTPKNSSVGFSGYSEPERKLKREKN